MKSGDAGWRLIRPTNNVSECRPVKRSAIRQCQYHNVCCSRLFCLLKTSGFQQRLGLFHTDTFTGIARHHRPCHSL
ncbi:hypothetical protein F6G07_19070 [Salmonella enterica]|uniref:Uncharacterized protein n=1 Tax=Salmonella enterica subsp. VII serovar 40:z4,z24:[z39] TaxID=1967625 RepID=A0A731XUF8_SALEE|nr:hypothetical protein [Salmonella enterica]EDO5297853.1 hypothetical protein [Salmonella enterica subsp. houtenae serovar 40:z4,z24:-]EDS6440667.1 hypothetical protein [Salmonella enterica subsp. VII str. CFSAN000550]EDT6885994.1 hypothetical protein [Salmonella enterica subsp. enterica]EDU7900710.1 hypothetical protein [Salmonella enterica subsp. houtenae]HAE4733322.1 hypothetical protein [Salmonella enterica subsp. VII serovar 40:z4,z24:[z39]]